MILFLWNTSKHGRVKKAKTLWKKKKKFKHIHYEPPRILNVILVVFICLSVPKRCRGNNTAKDTGVTKKSWHGIICEGPIRVVQKRSTWKYKARMKGAISLSSIIMQFWKPTVPSLQTNTEHYNKHKHLIYFITKYRAEWGKMCQFSVHFAWCSTMFFNEIVSHLKLFALKILFHLFSLDSLWT